MPSFSKDSFGGFVDFQRVAIDPNQIVGSKYFRVAGLLQNCCGDEKKGNMVSALEK
jgi:hypothetical protein